MGKHKSSYQDEIMLHFMKDNPDLARGFVKGDRVAGEAKWADLASALNANGPPIKDAAGWKKVWCDWKLNIRKKIAKNKAEVRATGGGPYSQQVVTDVEEEVAKICGLYEMVEGVAAPNHGAPPIVKPESEGKDEETRSQQIVLEEDMVPEPSRKRRRSMEEDMVPEPSRKRRRSNDTGLEALCAAQVEIMERMSNSMSEHFERIEAMQREDMELKRELLSKFSDILKKLGE